MHLTYGDGLGLNARWVHRHRLNAGDVDRLVLKTRDVNWHMLKTGLVDGHVLVHWGNVRHTVEAAASIHCGLGG
jgi:hypothetical protein